tara:strand:- start:2128 stop:2325 length:198 start_codon:yes stop_codon:yes gene_type:complete
MTFLLGLCLTLLVLILGCIYLVLNVLLGIVSLAALSPVIFIAIIVIIACLFAEDDEQLDTFDDED